MSYYMIDLAILAALVLFFFQGRKKGFVLTLCGSLAVFVAFLGALILSNLLCGPVGDLIQPALESGITQTLEERTDQDQWQLELHPDDPQAAEKPMLPIEQALSALTDSTLVRAFGESLRTAVRDGLLKVTSSVGKTISGYLARELARMALFLISFILVLLAWNILSRALDLAFRLPVLSTVNRTMGGLMGLVKGGLILFAAAWLLKGSILPQEVVADSVLLKFFCENSPLSLLESLMAP